MHLYLCHVIGTIPTFNHTNTNDHHVQQVALLIEVLSSSNFTLQAPKEKAIMSKIFGFNYHIRIISEYDPIRPQKYNNFT